MQLERPAQLVADERAHDRKTRPLGAAVDAAAVVGDREDDVAVPLRELDLDVRAAVLERVLQQLGEHERERGALVAAGPFVDQEDETFRGISIYRTGLAETRELANSDPSVQAGRMRVEVVTWLTPRGTVAFPGSDDEPKEER